MRDTSGMLVEHISRGRDENEKNIETPRERNGNGSIALSRVDV